jgi:AraC family transcriptional regulator
MRSFTHQDRQRNLKLDFVSEVPARGIEFADRLSLGGVALARCTSGPFEGVHVASPQIVVAMHDGASFEMEWRTSESDRLQSHAILHGHAHVGDGRLPTWIRHQASPTFFAFAIDLGFVAQIWRNAFDRGGDFAIRTAVGVVDPVIDRLCALGQHELSGGGPGDRLYLEGLAATFTAHLLREYGTTPHPRNPRKGGLAPVQLRRIIEYINAHLSRELGLIELAAVAGYSPHHFGEAFKIATGTPPHRYVIERRVRRARELLHNSEQSISSIAFAVGFSSQSHLTANFRRMTGLTPARFRRSLG